MKSGDLCQVVAFKDLAVRQAYKEFADMALACEFEAGVLVIFLEGPQRKSNELPGYSYVRVLTPKGVFWMFADAIGPL